MSQSIPSLFHIPAAPLPGAQPIQTWEAQYPETWLLLEITAEDDGEPLEGIVLATAAALEEFQEVWQVARSQGVLTMVTYGAPRTAGPEVVVSVT